MGKIAILGATGHVGQSIAAEFAKSYDHELVLLARNFEAAEKVADAISPSASVTVLPIGKFESSNYDVVVNAIGAGDSGRISSMGAKLMLSTEEWDNRIIAYLTNSPDTLYVCFSSGTAFGLARDEPVTIDTLASFPINQLSADHCYAVAKLNSETKHRTAIGLNIVDLRLFGFASRFADSTSGFFLSQVMAALKNDTILPTLGTNMVRDYVTPPDVCQLIEKCRLGRPVNRALDVYTKSPVSKFELLQQLTEAYGLKWQEQNDLSITRGSVEKNSYFSNDWSAAEFGYVPKFSALDGVVNEIGHYLEFIGKAEC